MINNCYYLLLSPLGAYSPNVVSLYYRCPELLLGCSIYSTALDMWSVGCVFAELLLKHPLFPGEGEIDQISKIFKILGIPTEESWPGVSSLPLFSQMSWRAPSRYTRSEL